MISMRFLSRQSWSQLIVQRLKQGVPVLPCCIEDGRGNMDVVSLAISQKAELLARITALTTSTPSFRVWTA